MTLQQLEYIRAVREYGHFGKAAEACGVTQSTLSLMIKKLEDELDVVIFDRDSHPIVPTSMGRIILDKANVVIYNSDQLIELTRSQKQLASGKVKLAMSSTIAPVGAPVVFKYIGDNYPAIRPTIQEMQSKTAMDMVRKAEIDMGVVVAPVDDPELLEIPLWSEKFLAYVSPTSPAYEKEEIEMDELLDHPLWIMKNGLRLFDRSMLKDSEKHTFYKMYEGGRAGTLIYLVNENGGMTIIPESHVGLILYSMQKNLRPIVNPEIRRQISLVIRKDYIHETMLNIVVDALRTIIPLESQSEMIKKGHITL